MLSQTKTAGSSVKSIEVAGPRLYLVQAHPEDIDDAFVEMYLNDRREERVVPRSRKPFSRDELRRFCADGIEKRQLLLLYGSEEGDSIRLVGWQLRLGVIDRLNGLSDMVALIGSTADRGKGLGTEVVTLGNRIAFDNSRSGSCLGHVRGQQGVDNGLPSRWMGDRGTPAQSSVWSTESRWIGSSSPASIHSGWLLRTLFEPILPIRQ